MGLPWQTTKPDDGTDESTNAAIDYDDAEEAMVAERLRALGYLE